MSCRTNESEFLRADGFVFIAITAVATLACCVTVGGLAYLIARDTGGQPSIAATGGVALSLVIGLCYFLTSRERRLITIALYGFGAVMDGAACYWLGDGNGAIWYRCTVLVLGVAAGCALAHRASISLDK